MTFNYHLEDMDGRELDATLAADDTEALAVFGVKVGVRLVPCDGAEASHRIVKAGHMPGMVRQGMRPEIEGDEPVVIFAKRAP